MLTDECKDFFVFRSKLHLKLSLINLLTALGTLKEQEYELIAFKTKTIRKSGNTFSLSAVKSNPGLM